MEKRRVVITGLGAITPIGNTVEEFWNGIKEEKVGIGPITKFDTTDYKVKIAAEVKEAIDSTLRFFGKFSANQLSVWSHLEGSPWSTCSDNGKDLYGQIDDSTIRTYFKEHVISPDPVPSSK